jgi:hypothetical protein
MVAAASPDAIVLPALEVEEPFAGPRDDCFRDEPVGKPLVVAGIEKTQRKSDAVFIDIDVRRSFPGTARIEMQ